MPHLNRTWTLVHAKDSAADVDWSAAQAEGSARMPSL
jgi:hypothetical protein